MFLGPPLPLSPDFPLSELLAYACPSETLGAWVRGCSPAQHVFRVGRADERRVLAHPDLGLLLTRCNQILVREGEQPLVLEAKTLIQWRALQVATATPYLPGLERLKEVFPDLHASDSVMVVPLRAHYPEEVLASCLAEGMPVTASRVVYVRPFAP